MYNYNGGYSQYKVIGNSQQRSNQFQYIDEQSNYRNYQKSAQCYQQDQLQDQALIQYYIFDDFQNLINLIQSLQTVSEYFNNDPKNEMIILSRNKVISQLNISNAIHFDIQQTYKDQKYQQLIQKEKKKVKDLISQLPSHIQTSQYLKLYNKNSLSDYIRYEEQPLEQINITANFNQQVVSQIFSSMQSIDKRIGQIKSQNYYPIPSLDEVKMKANQYEMLTRNKLEAAFGKQRKVQSQIYGDEKQFNASQQFDRNYPKRNSPQLVQSQIIGYPKQQRYLSTQHYPQEKQQSNYIGGYKNLGS